MTARGRTTRGAAAAVAVAAVALLATGCLGSASRDEAGAAAGRQGPATYSDAAGDSGRFPDLRRIDVSSTPDGRITFRVTLARLAAGARTAVDLWLDADADPTTGNTSFQGADGADYIFSAWLGPNLDCGEFWQQIPDGPGCIGQFAGTSWQPATARTARVVLFPNGVEFSINRSDLGDTNELNFFVYRGAPPPASPDRAPGVGAFSYSFELGGPRPEAAARDAGPNKAGGGAGERQRVLTLAAHDYSDPFAEHYVAAVKRLSGGSVTIRVKEGWRYYELDYERPTISDVRHGDVDLAVVGARAWDRAGVTSFRGAVAPFLVDSFALQRLLLESSLVEPMLGGVERLGLVGLALLPGGLRRPLGVARPLLAPDDFRGTTIGIRPAGVAQATFRALGGSAKAFPPMPTGLSGLDGAESDVPTIMNNRYDTRARFLTANVVLWPRLTTVVIDREAFDSLTADQQEALREAGREVLAPLLARLQADERTSLRALCQAGRTSLVTASAADRSALRKAVQPVYDRLDRDPLTRDVVAEIEKLRARVTRAQAVLHCAPIGVDRGPPELTKRWHVDLTAAELVAAGAQRDEAESFRGRVTVELARRQWLVRIGRTGAVYRGTYTVDDGTLALTLDECDVPGCTAGQIVYAGWSVYRDKLTLSRIPGRFVWPALVAEPWTVER
jgi:TRAP-type C4-dicarboxylate transport system substrate-binding protein